MEECNVFIDEVMNADECFCIGIVVVVVLVGLVEYKGKIVKFCDGKVGLML